MNAMNENLNPDSSDRPVFEAFSWTPDTPHDGYFAGHVHDVAHGIAKILELMEHDDIERCDADSTKRLMKDHDYSTLQRFAISAAQLLGDAAERRLAHINELQALRELK